MSLKQYIKNFFHIDDPIFSFPNPERFVIPYGEVIEYKNNPYNATWYPIESAPKDGTSFLTWKNHDYQIVWWSDYAECFWNDDCRRLSDFVWMPLPEAPRNQP